MKKNFFLFFFFSFLFSSNNLKYENNSIFFHKEVFKIDNDKKKYYESRDKSIEIIFDNIMISLKSILNQKEKKESYYLNNLIDELNIDISLFVNKNISYIVSKNEKEYRFGLSEESIKDLMGLIIEKLENNRPILKMCNLNIEQVIFEVKYRLFYEK